LWLTVKVSVSPRPNSQPFMSGIDTVALTVMLGIQAAPA